MYQYTEHDLTIFKAVAQSSVEELMLGIKRFLKQPGRNNRVIATKDYILARGNIPVMLIAHLDTVFQHPPKTIYYDAKEKVLWSPTGLGADDRAGVYGILHLLTQGYRPHICLTTDEEIGSVGAKRMISDFPQCPFNVKYIIELDRRGMTDCVFYDCDNPNFEKYVEKFGFKTAYGTFSDISEICPAWKIAGVNLSVGYYNEHSPQEILYFDVLHQTLDKVGKMLKDTGSVQKAFHYIPAYYPYYLMSKHGGLTYCPHCHKAVFEDEMICVVKDDGTVDEYCWMCIPPEVDWCVNCGRAFYTTDDEILCPTCKESLINEVTHGNI